MKRPDAVDEARAIDPVLVPGIPRCGAIVYAGAPELVPARPRTVPPAAFASVAVSVPVVVTALDGVDERTVPSPVNVTLVTVPVPAGISAVTRARNVGDAATPVVGPAKTRLADCVRSVSVIVPDVVTGEPVIV